MTTSFRDFFILNLHYEFSCARELKKPFVYPNSFWFTTIYKIVSFSM